MAPIEAPLAKATILGLGAMALAVLVVANDFTALSVALPAIERNLDADVTTVQWVISGYALVFGVLIVSGGRLADMLGRRRIFFLGSAIFGGAVGLHRNTALVVTAPSLAEGIHIAFLVNAALGIGGLAVSALFVGGRIDKERLRSLPHRHRAHA